MTALETKQPRESETKITNADLRRVFWRSFLLQSSFNYERLQGLGFCWSIMPILTKLYKKKEDLIAALKRHLEFFNTTSAFSTFIMGVAVSIEEENASRGDDSQVANVTAVKAALMGPLAGVGDAFFWGTFRVIAVGVGASMAVQGNFLGIFLYVLLYNIPHFVTRYYGTFVGYRFGVSFLQEIQSNRVLERVSEGASIVGMTVLGVMVATMVSLNTTVVFSAGGTALKLQEVLDQIMPSILPLGLVFGLYYLMRKNMKPAILLVGILVLGMLGRWLNILG